MIPSPYSATVVSTFLEVLTHEKRALELMAERIQQQPEVIEDACKLLGTGMANDLTARIIVSGVGKAGLVARKVGATLSSIGTAAVFMHAVDALHGDLGFVRTGDRALLFSYSGETVEVIRLARELQRLGCPLVAVTRSRTSTLGQLATTCVEMGEVQEACYMGLAPSSSTTVMLAVGDALALAVAKAKGFQEEHFGMNHPAGNLGLRFRYVREIMRTGSKVVCVSPTMPLTEVIHLVSTAKTGAALLVDAQGGLVGIFTDGDLRRALLRGSNILAAPVEHFASIPCHFIHIETSVANALKLFQNLRLEDLPVVDPATNTVAGMVCLKDIPSF